MSAFEEYAREKRAVDALLQDGYVIVSSGEQLEGMKLKFRRKLAETSEPEFTQLLLLTANARKYVSNLIIAEQLKRA